MATSLFAASPIFACASMNVVPLRKFASVNVLPLVRWMSSLFPLMLAAPNRLAILAGYTFGALVRALITGVLLFGVALIGGMQVDGGALGVTQAGAVGGRCQP